MALYVGLTIWMFLILLLGMLHSASTLPDGPGLINEKVAKSNKRIITIFTAISFLILWFLTAFRSSRIGNDTSTYIYYFNVYIDGIDRTRTFEIGYQYLNYFIGKFTTSPHLFIICIATIMYAGTVYYIYKYSNNVAISLVLFFCYFFSLFTTIFRQGIAMVIVLYGYQLLKDGKRVRAALLFILATTFHTTAIISFLFFLNASYMKKKKYVFGITLICGLLSGTGVINTVVSTIVPRYSHYFDSRYAASGWLAVSYSLIVYLVYYILVSKSVNEGKSDRLIATNFTLLLIFAAFGFSVNLFTRAGEYFLLIGVVELPNVISRGKINHYRIWLFGICTFLLIMFLVTLVYRPGWNHLYPYELWSLYD